MKTTLISKPRRTRRLRVARPAIKPARPTLWEVIQPFVGMADNLPADLALNHDHYLYGAAKRAGR